MQHTESIILIKSIGHAHTCASHTRVGNFLCPLILQVPDVSSPLHSIWQCVRCSYSLIIWQLNGFCFSIACEISIWWWFFTVFFFILSLTMTAVKSCFWWLYLHISPGGMEGRSEAPLWEDQIWGHVSSQAGRGADQATQRRAQVRITSVLAAGTGQHIEPRH